MKALLSALILLFVLSACKENVTEENLWSLIPIDGDGRISAAHNYKAIESFAKSFDNGIKLMSVTSHEVDAAGYSDSWAYTFLGLAKGVFYHFHSSNNSVAYDGTSSMLTGIMTITDGWMNSNVALILAEKNGGGEFRSKNSDCKISAALSQPLVPNSFPCWYFVYSSQSGKFYVTINAVTGQVVSN